ncbi:MAG: dephospho-CoA kinase, partial [Anaerolineaceae bacterium]|nr:dephospho-CoA kinase [Anaerolineaceae bacterium]
MPRWSGKFIIGLTGNIATGKSVVRRMLEHLGAYGIDADALAHRAITRGAPGYKPVLEMFGRWLLNPDGEINRSRLAEVVFKDKEALAALEGIIHPLVIQAVDLFVQRASQQIVVIEAIKLLESDLRPACNSIWVTYAPSDVQLERLIRLRGMSLTEARQRIESQPPQEEKAARADVVIKNISSFTETWRQVAENWKKTIPAEYLIKDHSQPGSVKRSVGEYSVVRAKPHHAAELASLVNRINRPPLPVSETDLMAEFGEKAFLMLRASDQIVGVMGWQVENLVSRVSDIAIEPSIPLVDALIALITEMEKASKDLQCEAALVFLQSASMEMNSWWQKMGYTQRSPKELGSPAWEEAA